MDLLLALLPPVLAISAALATRRIVPSLLLGALAGAAVAGAGEMSATARYALEIVRDALFDRDHTLIAIFSLLIGATVMVIRASGATAALIARLAVTVRGRRSAMVATWLSGLLLFFDDYANCLIVGNAFGPLYDRYGISRAKLAYIVDATAAPVASVALVSTWIGYELGLLDEGLAAAGLSMSGLALFALMLPYRFYGWFSLAFVGALAASGRDFGPMRRYEAEARVQSAVSAQEGAGSGRAHTAVVAITLLVGVTLADLWLTGARAAGPGAGIAEILGGSDPFRALLVGSAVSLSVAMAMVVGQRELSPSEALHAARDGARKLLPALLVLYSAWAIGAATEAAGTGDAVAAVVVDMGATWLLPSAIFLASALMAFATGTSFGTMAVMIPVVLDVAVAVSGGETQLLAASTSAVLAGACLGDHASPVSDTTVLSSSSSEIDVVTHVRTQAPYVAVVGTISIGAGYLPAGLGLPVAASLGLGLATSVGAVFVLGRLPGAGSESSEPDPSM